MELRLAANTDSKRRSVLDERHRKIQSELNDLDKRASKATAQGSFLGKMGDALEILDLHSVGAQVAASLSGRRRHHRRGRGRGQRAGQERRRGRRGLCQLMGAGRAGPWPLGRQPGV